LAAVEFVGIMKSQGSHK